MDGLPTSNPYLTGNFAPVRSEDDFELEVVGEIPRRSAGAFYRNGPNPQFEPRGHYHWFTGDGMIHGFFVEGGKVSYRNRYVRTPKWRLENAAGRALFGGFDPRGADPSAAGQGQRRRQHQHRLARQPSAGAGGSPQAVRTRSASAWNRAAMSTTTGAASPPTRRSIPRPARWSGSAIPSATGRSRRPSPMA